MYVIHLESDLTHFNYSYSIYVALCRRSYSNLAGRFRHLLAHSTSDIQRRVFRNSNCLHNLYSNIIYTNESSCLVNQIFRLSSVRIWNIFSSCFSDDDSDILSFYCASRVFSRFSRICYNNNNIFIEVSMYLAYTD